MCSANSILPMPVALSMTTMPPSAKGLPVGGLVTAVPTWRLQRLVESLRPSCVTTQLYDPILHCSRNVSRGDDGTVKDDIAPRRATLSFQRDPMDTEGGQSCGSKIATEMAHALDLDRIEPLEDKLTSSASSYRLPGTRALAIHRANLYSIHMDCR